MSETFNSAARFQRPQALSKSFRSSFRRRFGLSNGQMMTASFVVAEGFVIAVAFLYYDQYATYLPLLLLGCIYFYYSLRYPLLWVVSVILLHTVYLYQKSEGISPLEVLFAIYFYAPLAIWFYDKIIIRGEKIVRTKFDLLLLTFTTVCVLSVVLTLLNEFSVIKWFRELIVFMTYLLYFPLREAIRSKRDLLLIVWAFLVLALFIAVNNLIQYKTSVAVATYFWEITGGRRTANEPLFFTSIVVGSAVIFHIESRRLRFILTLLILFFLTALIVTFSRGYWLGTIIGLSVIFMFVPWTVKRRLLMYAAIFLLLFTVVVFLLFGDLGDSILRAVEYRMLSVGSAGRGISTLNRVIEVEAIFSKIKSNPILGYGLGATFPSFNLFKEFHSVTDYSHNAFLYIWFKLGLIGFFTFFGAYALMIKEGIQLMRKKSAFPLASLALGIVGILIAMLFISFSSPQFYAKDSVLIITLGWGIIYVLRHNSPVEATQ